MARNYILDTTTAQKKLERMAYEILENNIDEKEIVLASIEETGVAIANTIAHHLKNIQPSILISQLNVRLNKKQPDTVVLSETGSLSNKVVILIDDVSNSGKTLLWALSAFLPHQPKKIQTLALVERTHKQFPIKTDYVGLSLATTLQDHIQVECEEDEVKGAYME
jgi:pyrimidine operon attenuation protein/uracil phosphoribosyltransferase